MITDSGYTENEISETKNEFRKSVIGKRVPMQELLANPEFLQRWNNCVKRTDFTFGLFPATVSGLSLFGLAHTMHISKFAPVLGIFGWAVGYFIGKKHCFNFCVKEAVGVRVVHIDSLGGELHLTFDTELLPVSQQKETLESEQPKQSNVGHEDFQFSNIYSNDLHSINGIDEYTSVVNNKTEPSDSQKSVTYNELRQKHRQKYRQDIQGKNEESQQKAPPSPPFDTETIKPVRRNKYGDMIE